MNTRATGLLVAALGLAALIASLGPWRTGEAPAAGAGVPRDAAAREAHGELAPVSAEPAVRAPAAESGEASAGSAVDAPALDERPADTAPPGPGELVVTGLVLEPDGRPSPRARVFASEVRRGVPPALDLLMHGLAEEDGTFRLVTGRGPDLSQIYVTASGTQGEVVSPSPFGGTRDPDPLLVGRVVTAVPSERPASVHVQVRLAATLKVLGTVVDHTGAGVTGEALRLWRRDGHRPELEPFERALVFTAESRGDGRFALTGLDPGRYVLESLGSTRGAATRVEVNAGDEAVRFELGAPRIAEVTVEVVSADAGAKFTVLRGLLTPAHGASLAPPVLPAVLDVRAAEGFPDFVGSLWQGSHESSDANGRWHVTARPSVAGRETYSIPAGYAWFGARGAAGDGTPLAPAGTGLVELGPGPHFVRIHLAP